MMNSDCCVAMSCVGCFKAHFSCDLQVETCENGGKLKSCSRCQRMNLLCVVREQKKRGRPKKDASELERELKVARVTDCGTETEHREVQGGEQGNEATFEGFFPQENAFLQYQAASAVSALCRSRGFVPESLKWYIRTMTQFALKQRSLAVLHAMTTLSVSLHLEDPTLLLTHIPQPNNSTYQSSTRARETIELTNKAFLKDFLTEDQSCVSCSYMVVIHDGVLQVHAGPNWQSMFQPLESMWELSKSKPGFHKFWLHTVYDLTERARLQAKCMKVWFDSTMEYDKSGMEEYWHYSGGLKDFVVQDVHGDLWMVDMEETDAELLLPSIEFRHTVRFHNMRHVQRDAVPFIPLADLDEIESALLTQESGVAVAWPFELEPLDSKLLEDIWLDVSTPLSTSPDTSQMHYTEFQQS